MLTYRDEVGGVRIEGCNSENEVEKIKSCVERLNDYERIGLTPGQVRTLIRKYRELRESEAARTSDADVREVMEEYNRACPSLPQCRTVTDRRRVRSHTGNEMKRRRGHGEGLRGLRCASAQARGEEDRIVHKAGRSARVRIRLAVLLRILPGRLPHGALPCGCGDGEEVRQDRDLA